MNHTKVSPRSSSSEFDGSDFSNNLFSDLAPLLTLFGEQVTKQFLSQAMGYGDDILLAMAPLGILTCVVSAIRVGGRKWLKALVGRARESRATAEMEIMSSTSDAVCELWSGAEIVRERGRPKTKEFIYRPVNEKTESTELLDSKIVYDLRTACEDGVLTITQPTPRLSRWLPSKARPLIDDRTQAVEYATQLMQQAPNLTLNVTKAITSTVETWAFASLGIAIQLAVLVIASLVTYHWRLGQNGTSSIARYGFPLFLIGSVLLCAGIFLCSYIIETITEEVDFDLVEHRHDTKVVRIQCACTVGDQHFGSYAIMNEEGNTTLRTSRINDNPDFSVLSIIATGLSLGGYILQFVGLRAMHWSVAITVLGATLIMACVRAYVRRGLAANPKVHKLHQGHELSWLALDAFGLSSFDLGSTATTSETVVHGKNDSPHGDEVKEETRAATSSVARKVVEVRKELRQLVPWPDESIALAHQLAKAITETLQYVTQGKHFEAQVQETSVLAFERRTVNNPTTEENGTDARVNTGSLLSCTLYSAREYRDLLDDARKGSDYNIGVELGRTGGKDGASEDLVKAISGLAAAVSMEARSRHNKRAGRHDAETDAKLVETKNWFWENRDVIEEAASDSELKAPPGFAAYIFHQSTETFGLSFKWDSEVILGDVGLGESRTATYRFLTRCISQRLEDDEEEVASEGFVSPRARRRNYSTKDSWTIDVEYLAAILSLWTLTLESRLGPDTPPRGFIRLLGSGWQVPVPVEAFVEPGDESKTKVEKWRVDVTDKDGSGVEHEIESEAENSSSEDEGRDHGPETEETQRKTDNSTSSNQGQEDTKTDVSTRDEDPGWQHSSEQDIHLASTSYRGQQEYKRADFYGVWIQRKTPAITLDPQSDLGDMIGYRFGATLSSHSRNLRVEALQGELEGDPNSITRSRSRSRGRSSRRSSQDRDRRSTLLTYLSPDGVILEAKDSPAPWEEETAVRTRTSLPRLCAQEIFSAFMLQLVASITEIKGEARRRTPLRGDHAGTLRWDHRGLSRLAGIVRDSKLATDEEEAYMLIIPAFHAHGLLPTRAADDDGSSSSYEYGSYSYYSSSSESSDRRTRRSRRTRLIESEISRWRQ